MASDHAADADIDDLSTPAATTVRWLLLFRLLIGIGGLVSLGVQYEHATNDADQANTVGASAIQIVQVWTPHIFDAIVIVGVTLTLYVLSRAFD